MQFREWLQLDEIQHVSLPKPLSINGIYTDGIDFRFEDWKQGYNPEKGRNVLAPRMSGEKFFSGSFSAPLRGGTWLNIGREPGASHFGNLSLAVGLKPQIQIEAKPLFQPLPGHWFDFAVLYMGNAVVKTPEWPRDASEKRALTVAEVEPV